MRYSAVGSNEATPNAFTNSFGRKKMNHSTIKSPKTTIVGHFFATRILDPAPIAPMTNTDPSMEIMPALEPEKTIAQDMTPAATRLSTAFGTEDTAGGPECLNLRSAV